jgi:sirohydrochlorin cobaltochelatase
MIGSRHGVLLFAHGARDPAWSQPFEAVARRCIEQRPERPLALAYLDFMRPTVEEAATALAAQGCSVVDVVPLFLGTGGHVRRDVPRLVAAIAARFPAVRWQLRPTVGESPEVVDAMARAALSPAPQEPHPAPEQE